MPLRSPRPRTYAETCLADDPYGLWSLNEGGPVYFDLGPHNWTLKTIGAPTPGKPGGLPNDLGRSVLFAGSTADALQTVSTLPAFPSTSYTVEMVALATGAGSYTAAFVPRGGGGASGAFFGVNGAVANTVLLYDLGHSPSEANGVTTLVDSRWHHLAATFDGANVRIYVDGRLDNTVATTSAAVPAAAVATIGSEQVANAAWQGRLQYVGYYTKALTGTQILAHAQAMVAPGFMVPVVRNLPAVAATGWSAGPASPGPTWRRRYWRNRHTPGMVDPGVAPAVPTIPTVTYGYGSN